MSFMNFKALCNSIDFDVNSVHDIVVDFVDIESGCLMELDFCECVDAYGFKDLLTDGEFHIPGAVCLGFRIVRVYW